MLCSAAPVEISAAVVCIYHEAEEACSHGREEPGKPPLQLYVANPSHLDPALASASSRAAENQHGQNAATWGGVLFGMAQSQLPTVMRAALGFQVSTGVRGRVRIELNESVPGTSRPCHSMIADVAPRCIYSVPCEVTFYRHWPP